LPSPRATTNVANEPEPARTARMTRPPLRFTFGVHLHQPVGNFDSVFEEHVRDVYLPFLERMTARDVFPIALHLSGPLLEWLEAHDARYLDLLGPLVADGKVELLLAGMYEPVLAVLPREDRLEQIAWMREAIQRRFGVTARGLWLTERVWEPGLAADLADAGVDFALVDDHHFAVAGIPADRLHAPWYTESGGKRVALFPIDQRLRYLIPFQHEDETADYLRGLRAAGHSLAVLADDGEKFGGWPGTREWVYDRGWLDRFIATLERLRDEGEVVLSTFADALSVVPSGGLAYLPAASYREMEAWSLPTEASVRLAQLERDLGPERIAGPDGALVRGGHWRNFQVKYAESNRLHKRMLATSALCRERGDPTEARRAVGRGQCNDAYWHGVFGGLYLPHLRQGVWRELARAEGLLRAGEGLAHEIVDHDFDGALEVRVHGAHFAAVVSPARGGAIEELTLLAPGINLADTLTRRREPYHVLDAAAPAFDADADAKLEQHGERAGTEHGEREHAPSIHEIEQALRLTELPPVDVDVRALFVERVLEARVTREDMEGGRCVPLHSWAGTPLAARVQERADVLEVALIAEDGSLEKRIRFAPEGAVEVAFRWTPAAYAPGSVFTTELSTAWSPTVGASAGLERWTYPIVTVGKSERGLERTVQGEAIVLRWPIEAGTGVVTLSPPMPEGVR
jgi:Glycosyl hydrolase family 57/Domain of unknown function (DUF1925)/Domain of unknown function (DUF1926)